MSFELDHVQLATPAGGDETARAFWVDVVGLAEQKRPPNFDGRPGMWFAVGGLSLHLGVEADFRPAKKAHPAFRVGDADALAERLAAAGRPVRWDDDISGVRRFFSEDPFGNRLEFVAARHMS